MYDILLSSNRFGYRRQLAVVILCCLSVFCGGCPKARNDAKYAREAEKVQDFDAAVGYYERAAQSQPNDIHVQIKLADARAKASQGHLQNGQKLLAENSLEEAVEEFRRAALLDPSNEAAQQNLESTLAFIAAKDKGGNPKDASHQPNSMAYSDRPPQLKELSHSPINLKMSNDARIVYETIAKLAGITVIFDPDFPARRVSVELDDVTFEEALDIVSIESKAFWRPLSENVVWVIPDQPQKRRDFDDQVIQTFYLSNVVQPQDLTEIVTGLRQLLELKRIQQLNSQSAIVIRDTPAKLAAAQKLIEDADRAKPEVVLQVEVLQARTDLTRKLGINPGTSASLAFNPCARSSSSSCSSSSSTSDKFSLKDLKHLSSNDYSVTLPGASVTALLSDTFTQIIQNPEIRSIDGQSAKLKVGDRVPVATGSFQTGTAASAASALVNTQYQYIDVGVNIDVTPHIHPNREVSLKVNIEVSSVTGYSTIGTLQEPIISQRKIEHEIRLKEGEVSILGGLFERTDSRSRNGWPGLSKVPFLSYLTSEKDNDLQENEVLIVLTPRVVRISEIGAANLRALYTGLESNLQLMRAPASAKPDADVRPASKGSGTQSGATTAAGQTSPAAQPGPAPLLPKGSLSFEPHSLNLRPGETSVLKLNVHQVEDLFSIPILFEYNPKVISIEEVRHGRFFSDGSEEIALVQQIDKDRGLATISATRPPKSPGVSGDGPLLEITVRAVGPGTSEFKIPSVHAKNSKLMTIELRTDHADIRVSQP